MSSTTFGTRLRSWRMRHGLGQEQAARLIGVSLPCLSHWENGRHMPSYSYYARIRSITGIMLDEPMADTTDRERLTRIVERESIGSAIDRLEPDLRNAIAQVPPERHGELLALLREAVRG